MGQRVNIQYSVDIEDLPQEVERMANKAFYQLTTLAEQSQATPSPTLSLDSHRQIDELRRELATLDIALSDLNNLIGSYLAYKTQQIMKDPAASAPETAELDPEQLGETPLPLSELQEKIAHFKQSLGVEEANIDQPNQG